MTRRALRVGTPLVLLVLLVGCGEDDGTDTAAPSPEPTTSTTSGSPSPTPSESESAQPSLPACAEVWVDGKRLPAGYAGCLEDGVVVEPETQPCAFAGAIVTYADRFYAVRGRQVNDVGGSLRQSEDYRRAVESCSG